MSQPTRQEIIDAIERRILDAPHHDFGQEVLGGRILAALPPNLPLSMADIEWDDDEHYLAEAEVGTIKLVMLRTDPSGWIRGFHPETGQIMAIADPAVITLTGKRYQLTEVQE